MVNKEKRLMRGRFITFEGPDGGGKSTQIRLLSEWLRYTKGYDVLVTREPGGCTIAEEIRETILDIRHEEMMPITEAMLYASARAQHVQEVILPALNKGTTVICDRFVDSSIAYQGYGRELGAELIEKINEPALDGLTPDLTFYCRVEANIARQRVWRRAVPDRIESEKDDFQARVLKGFDDLVKQYPDRIFLVDASNDIEGVYHDIIRRAEEIF